MTFHLKDYLRTNESKFSPPKNRKMEFDEHIQSLNNVHIENLDKSFRSNLNKREWIELNQLKNNPDNVVLLEKLTSDLQ